MAKTIAKKETESPKWFKIYAHTAGIKKRARTQSRHSFDIGTATLEEMKDEAAIKLRVEKFLLDAMKTFATKNVQVNAYLCWSTGPDSYECGMFSEENVKFTFELSNA